MATTLIDRDYALLQLRMGELENCGVFETDSAHIKDFLNTLPNVDAMEVVHGRWLWHDDEFEYVCSACKCRFNYNHTFGIFDHDYEYGNYCPNCGAKMDLK